MKSRWSFLKTISLAVLFSACFYLLKASRPGMTQEVIHFSGEATENDFPDSMTFRITVATTQGIIERAKLYFATRNAISTTQQVIEFDPASEVTLFYTWDTSNITIPPGAPILYHWEVKDSQGNVARTDEVLVYYDDTNYEWHVNENENLAVWYHDRPEAFGKQVFEIAKAAFEEQRHLFGAELIYQMRIIVYNDFEEFANWHTLVQEFVGGQAFPSLGITTQVVSAYATVDRWLNDVIPHEISHLYLYQATYHPYNEVPAWLNEGLAQYNEFVPDPFFVEYAHSMIAKGELLPLWSLTGSFGTNESEVRLVYAESLSAATFLIEEYGADGLSNLLAAYRQGLNEDEAFKEGLGATLFEFQARWLEWMGVDPALYPPPTPMPTMAWPTAPQMAVTPSRVATRSETRAATQQTSMTATPTTIPTEAAKTVIASTEPTTSPRQNTPTATPVEPDGDGFCSGAAFLMFLMIGVGLLFRGRYFA